MGRSVIVIGGGAAGLVAAIAAAREGATVTILEHGKKTGQKILATGNGKCNLGNLNIHAGHYRSGDISFVWDVLDSWNASDTIKFFTKLGIYVKNKDGYLYPQSGQASSVLQVLLMEAQNLKVKIKNSCNITSIHPKENGWEIATEGWSYESDCVILATGSPASNLTEADDSGYALAKELGYKIITPLPALVPLVCEGVDTRQWAGIRINGKVSLVVDGDEVAFDTGELQLTDYGVSGIPVFQVSSMAVRSLHEKKDVKLRIDFMPDMKLEDLQILMESRINNCPYKSSKEQYIGLLPDKLIELLPQENSLEWLKQVELTVTGSKSFQQAQVCSGGVDVLQIDAKTMESKQHKGLYFAGEIMDVDGDCGGYNLHWAWATGAISGKAAAKEGEV